MGLFLARIVTAYMAAAGHGVRIYFQVHSPDNRKFIPLYVYLRNSNTPDFFYPPLGQRHGVF